MIITSAYRQTQTALGLFAHARPAAAASPSAGANGAALPAPAEATQNPAVILSRTSHRESSSLKLYGPTGMTLDGLFAAGRGSPAEQQRLVADHKAARDLDAKKAKADEEVDGLSQKIAENTRKLAADHVATLREAARKAKLLGLIDPKGAVEVTKSYSRQLARTAREFGSANAALAERRLARLEPRQETTITRETAVEASAVELRTGNGSLRQAARDAVLLALGGLENEAIPSALDGPEAADVQPDAVAEANEMTVSAVAISVTETVTVATAIDSTKVDGKAAAIEEGRLDRLAADAEVIKEAILALRELKTMMAVAAKAAAKQGLIDKEFRKEFKEANAEFRGAIDAVIEAAMPVVEAGFSIDPDEPSAA